VILLENSNNNREKNRNGLKNKEASDLSLKESSINQKTQKKGEINESEKKYHSDEINNLDIPAIPEPPKKSKITLKSPGLSTRILQEVKKLENKSTKVVLVNCERCNEVIAVPIPKKFIIKSKIPVVPVSFVHNNPDAKDLHCITLYLDKDYDIRRQRISDVVISDKE